MRALATLAAVLAIGGPAAAAAPAHVLSVRLDPQARTLAAHDVITFDSPRAATLVLSARFALESLVVDGRRVEPNARTDAGIRRISVAAARRVELRWKGTLAALDRGLDHRGALAYGEPASGAQGTFLPAGSGWYPAVEGELERYRVTLDLPAGQKGLVPGRLLEESEGADRYRASFEFPAPAEGIALMAGPYRVEERRARTAAGTEVRLRTYFHAEIAALARDYLDALVGYLDLYERWIGPYAFSEFSVVSSPTPTGFGMPTLTYLGIQVLRLPFIRETSLGHEVLHNWWGNGVYPDTRSGNWSEALTTFMADYAYRERTGAEGAKAMRLAWLRDYAAMPPEEDAALARFASRTHGASQIVGYHKGAMVFFMLRDAIGAAAFDEGVRWFWREYRFRVASWDDLRGAFERASGRSLAAFFGQWIARPGAPDVRIAGAQAAPAGSRWRLSVTLAQDAPPYALSVPLAVRTRQGEVARRVELARERGSFEIELEQGPLSLVLDPELRLFRRLAPGEAPPILREVILARDAELFAASADQSMEQAMRGLAARLFERAPRLRSARDRPDAAAVLVAGRHEHIDQWLAQQGLPGRPAGLAAARGSAQVWTARFTGKRTTGAGILAVVSVRDAEALAAIARPLPHYGQQSFLIFDGERVTERGLWPSQPQAWRFDNPVPRRSASEVNESGARAPDRAP